MCRNIKKQFAKANPQNIFSFACIIPTFIQYVVTFPFTSLARLFFSCTDPDSEVLEFFFGQFAHLQENLLLLHHDPILKIK
jgi:hypothetical protein